MHDESIKVDWKSRHSVLAYYRRWYQKHKNSLRAEKLRWYHANKHVQQLYKQKWGEAVKRKALTQYGRKGILQCCWPLCNATDIDVLTLDHVNNDGHRQRRKLRHHGGGSAMYAWVIKHGFPKGFQTLCANHQLKKEIHRRKEKLRKEANA